MYENGVLLAICGYDPGDVEIYRDFMLVEGSGDGLLVYIQNGDNSLYDLLGHDQTPRHREFTEIGQINPKMNKRFNKKIGSELSKDEIISYMKSCIRLNKKGEDYLQYISSSSDEIERKCLPIVPLNPDRKILTSKSIRYWIEPITDIETFGAIAGTGHQTLLQQALS